MEILSFIESCLEIGVFSMFGIVCLVLSLIILQQIIRGYSNEH